jgi:hypothetical protein
VPKKAAAPASKTAKPVAAAKENAMPAAAPKALVVKPEQSAQRSTAQLSIHAPCHMRKDNQLIMIFAML